MAVLSLGIGVLHFIVHPTRLDAQGCVAVRGSGMCSLGHTHGGTNLLNMKWQGLVAYRYFQSDRHFRGTHEEPHRKQGGTEVINDSHFIDLSIAYAITPRYSVALVLPFVYHDRSSLYEHRGSGGRHNTGASGLSDMRLTAYAWLLDPLEHSKGNVQVGIGLKAPTGDYSATDTFITANNVPVLGYVDQSIQPGDGGWGFSLEMNAYRVLHERWIAFLQGFYLFNPQNINGTPTRTGGTRGNPYEQVMSIPDQYFGRGGINYILVPKWNVAINLAGRIEGVPVRDAIGRDDGFRRPGYAISVEPGINWMPGQWNVALSVPVRVHANRQRSVADERWTQDSGTFRHGDAAFADYLISFSVARNF